MENKICLITGGTGGIGKVAAINLVKQGFHVIVHGRDKAKAEAVQKEIIEKCGHDKVDILLADLTSMEEVRSMATAFNSRYDHLDVLINNAGGIMNNEREETKDGFEKTMALNLFAPFVLTALLFDKLKVSKKARIINLSSGAHNFANPDFNDFLMGKKYSSVRAYGNAKLYVIFLTREMSRRLRFNKVENVVVNAMHPGVVATNFSKESNSIFNKFFSVFKVFLLSPEKGADTIVYLASDPNGGDYSGFYFEKRKPGRVNDKYATKENAAKVWELTEMYTGVKFL